MNPPTGLHTPAKRRKARRENAGMGITDLAMRVGVTRITLWRWENDKVEPHPALIALWDRELARAEKYNERKLARETKEAAAKRGRKRVARRG